MDLTPLSKTRTLFLRTVSLCYAFAFASLYPQIPGLYGPTGLLPAKPHIDNSDDAYNLLKVLPGAMGISVDLTMDLLCLAGTTLAMLMTLLPGLTTKLPFLILWVSYKSLYGAGQTFLWFQWDILLLEVGFLCLLVAPAWGDGNRTRPWDPVNMFLVRWLLFRMMFSSGAVKLLSECPAWWGLTALPLHYESQCLPTYLGFVSFHALPDWLHRLSVVGTYVIEMPLTFLFAAPNSHLRKFTFWMQVKLMVVIMLTGNYNFFNLLYVALCFSLMDDTWVVGEKKDKSGKWSTVRSVASGILSTLVYASLTAGVAYFFVSVEGDLKINFTKLQFRTFVDLVGEWSVHIGLSILAFISSRAIFQSLLLSRGLSSKTYHFAITLCYVLAGLAMFILSVPQYLQGMGIRTMPAELPAAAAAEWSRKLDLTHSYGLFRSMTGIGGRPEVVLEKSMSAGGPWTEVGFRYKPGKLDAAPLFVLPHQPRLDWQMWFAALGTYQHNPWLLSLMYRILENDDATMDLLATAADAKRTKPNYVRARLYKYHFADYDSGNYWRRELDREYVPAVDSEELRPILSQVGIVQKDGKDWVDTSSNSWLKNTLMSVRRGLAGAPHHKLVQSLILAVVPVLWTLRNS